MGTVAAEAPPQTSRRQFLINNLVAALIGATAMVMVHEAAHTAAGVALGHPSTQYAFGVTHEGDPSPTDQVIMLLAAPAFSLVTGVLMALWTPLRSRSGHAGFGHLVWLWFAFTSIQEGITYLCLTPFGAGDTGEAATLLGLPVAVQLVALAVGVAGMFANARAFATHLARHAGADHPSRMAMSLYVWLFGMIIQMLLAVLYLAITPVDLSPANQIAVVVAGTAILVFAPMANMFHRQVAGVAHEPLRLPRIPLVGLIAWAALVVANLLLSFGLRVG